jgi:hypothetical protein
VLRPERNKRPHLSSVLSRNEVARDYAYNRKLFRRMDQGWYQFNPQLLVRRQTQDGDCEGWQPLFASLNLQLIGDFVRMEAYRPLQALAQASSVTVAELPMLKAERILQARRQLQAQEEAQRQREAERQRLVSAPKHISPAPWGTPQARAQEIERLRTEIAARRAADSGQEK